VCSNILQLCTLHTWRCGEQLVDVAFASAGLIVNIGSVCSIRPQKKACACGLQPMAMHCMSAVTLLSSRTVAACWQLSPADSIRRWRYKVGPVRMEPFCV
jgi:hypothetical protein